MTEFKDFGMLTNQNCIKWRTDWIQGMPANFSPESFVCLFALWEHKDQTM